MPNTQSKLKKIDLCVHFSEGRNDCFIKYISEKCPRVLWRKLNKIISDVNFFLKSMDGLPLRDTLASLRFERACH